MTSRSQGIAKSKEWLSGATQDTKVIRAYLSEENYSQISSTVKRRLGQKYTVQQLPLYRGADRRLHFPISLGSIDYVHDKPGFDREMLTPGALKDLKKKKSESGARHRRACTFIDAFRFTANQVEIVSRQASPELVQAKFYIPPQDNPLFLTVLADTAHNMPGIHNDTIRHQKYFIAPIARLALGSLGQPLQPFSFNYNAAVHFTGGDVIAIEKHLLGILPQDS